MSPKPFGKPIRRWRMPPLTRGAVLVAVLSPVAWLILAIPARNYPLLDADALYWPSLVGFGALFLVAGVLWIRKRPVPRGPWESGSFWRFVLHLFLSALVAAPLALACTHCYEPGLRTLNATLGSRGKSTAYALLDRKKNSHVVLRSPYWGPDLSVAVPAIPDNTPLGSIATLTVSRGALGALWIRDVQLQELP